MSHAILVLTLLSTGGLPSWEFETPDALDQWKPNAHLEDAAVAGGVLHARAVDWDPYFHCTGIELPANPWQYVLIRIKASRGGTADLFWSGATEGPNGGLTEKKKTSFQVSGDGAWREIPVFPFWHVEGAIRQMRLDVYPDAEFDIDWIRVASWGDGVAPAQDVYAWTFPDGDMSAWTVTPQAGERFSPPLDLPLGNRGFVTVRLSAAQDCEGRVLWAAPETSGLQFESFCIRGDGRVRDYNVEVQSYPSWGKRIAMLGLRLPPSPGFKVESVSLNETPIGPPDLQVVYFGCENGVNRAGCPARVIAHVENRGGASEQPITFALEAQDGLRVSGNASARAATPVYAETADAVFEVAADQPGTYTVKLRINAAGAPETEAMSVLEILPAVSAPAAGYPPEPRPVDTDLDVLAYYFPGWATEASWDCIRRIAPNRKPLLGYYDEANPECVDWQIKWAVENGITGFLVDWYWNKGSQHLTHWFEAYRKARYRDMLRVAVMWANHNPPGSHSRDDWRAVTREWVDRYFSLPSYYRLNDTPAVFLWAPNLIRSDLGGSAEVKAAFAESQQTAREAGYRGILFVAVNDCQSTADARTLLDEGYFGATNYHEWGRATELSTTPNRAQFQDVTTTAPEKWAERNTMCGDLVYFPLVDTGWDSRPWHGAKSLVISGRTVPLFEELLRAGKEFSRAQERPFVVLGPVNEWGEGSYIEPCTEFGFGMYEAVRRVFAAGAPEAWPVNIGPADAGLGPYDLPAAPPTTAWDFGDGCQGWSAMMGVTPPASKNGCLYFETTSSDPALQTPTRGLLARDAPALRIRMRIDGPVREGERAQLFWSCGGAAMSEATSVDFVIAADGGWRNYEIDLSRHPRWRGRISALRFDPCATRDAKIHVDTFAFQTGRAAEASAP